MNEEQRKFWETLAEHLGAAARQTNDIGHSKLRRSPSTAAYHFGAATTLAGLSAAIQHTLDETD